jgi:hypothetical protein
MNHSVWDWRVLGAVFGVVFVAQLAGKSDAHIASKRAV